MKIFLKRIEERSRSIIQIILLIISFFLPVIVDASNWIEFFLQNSELNFENAKYYFMLKAGNWIIGIGFMLFVLNQIRKTNKEKVFNTKNVYHNYPYIWYWICAKVLGYTKCNLKLVPIYLQFELVMNDTFAEYDVGTDDDYPIIENEEIKIDKLNWNQVSQEINLVLEDTYPITKSQLPVLKKALSTIRIVRKRPDQARYYSPQFVAKIVDEIRKLPSNVNTVNVFATTNPKHTKQIAGDAFKLAERGNVKKLFVFPQSNKGKRKFERKGKMIYSYD